MIDAPATIVETTASTFPAILKTARLGYDGKGQVPVRTHSTSSPTAWRALGDVPCVLEQRLPLDRELSVVLARARRRPRCACYPVAQNTHVNGILDLTVVPAHTCADTGQPTPPSCAPSIAEALDYVGVLAVEMFVVGTSAAGERARAAPAQQRPLDARRCAHQPVRAAGARRVRAARSATPTLVVPGVAMVNLLGDLWAGGEPDWARRSTAGGATCTCTASPNLDPGARWVTSRCTGRLDRRHRAGRRCGD